MKNLILTFSVLLLILSPFTKAISSEGPVELSDLEVGFLYYKVSKLPIPWDHFANHYAEYRSARDEFQRIDVMEQIKPILQNMQMKVNNNNSFVIKSKSTLGEYDFKNNGFPAGLSDTTFIPISTSRVNMKGPDFGVRFINGHDFSFLKLTPQEAREKVILLRDSRDVIIEVEYEPQSATEETAGFFATYRMIKGKIKGIKVFASKSGRLVGEVK